MRHTREPAITVRDQGKSAVDNDAVAADAGKVQATAYMPELCKDRRKEGFQAEGPQKHADMSKHDFRRPFAVAAHFGAVAR